MGQNKLRLQIITPQRPVLDKRVDFVALPACNGEMGVLPGHIQYVAKLNYGVLRYKDGAQEGTFAVMGGLAEIEHNNVSVFAEDAALEDEIDIEEERQKLVKAKAALSAHDSDIDMELAEMEIKKALLLLKVKSKHPKL
ncbi:MAG: ATP synthase F1 subunit epsilon [Elusimicrobiota bacterium]|jgi:F-type H+-transporting ATPase subunit epsilon|nr:ATP synthase F1 subunit epsilon [Elusimicrobiota bacterium]